MAIVRDDPLPRELHWAHLHAPTARPHPVTDPGPPGSAAAAAGAGAGEEGGGVFCYEASRDPRPTQRIDRAPAKVHPCLTRPPGLALT